MELYVNPQITGFRQEVDGTIKELKIGSSKEDAYANIQGQVTEKVENNKAATINVSTYSAPVEITPTSGKTSMKKATITLSNIPSPTPTASVTFYAWITEGDEPYYTLSATPSINDKVYGKGYDVTSISYENPGVVKTVGEGTIEITIGGGDVETTRNSEGDVTFLK